MSALSDLLAARTSLDDAQVSHLQRLVGEWQLLADLSFSDLLLWIPVADGVFLCAAQCRPTTGPTAYLHDQVGIGIQGSRAMPMRIALTEGRIYREADPDWDGDLPIRREAIPVRAAGEVIAVLGRDSNLASVRSPSQLELVYLQSAADLAAMVADGTFPGPAGESEEGAGPRVGDGLMRVERDGTILYASPNALSAFRRLGVTGNVLGEPIDMLTSTVADDPFDASDLAQAIRHAVDGGNPTGLEVDGGGATVAFKALPLHPRGEVLGALILMHDVTELRNRDRQLMSKDATIREIHHRVKNNLQTVAALLRLQARRVAQPRGAHRARGIDAADQLDRARPRHTVGIGGRGGRVRRGGRPAPRHAGRRRGVGGQAAVTTDGDLRRDPGGDRDRAGTGADRVGAERRGARLPGPGRRHGGRGRSALTRQDDRYRERRRGGATARVHT